MPCKDAILANPIVGHPDQKVEELMAVLEENHIRCAPVIDKDTKKLLGLFGLDHVMKALLPVSATMEDGLQRLDFVIGAAPGVAKRLRKLKPRLVQEVMERDCRVVHPDTPTWEAVRLLVKYGSPIPVVNEENGVLVGIISEQSALADLKNILKELEEEGEFEGEEAC